MLRKLNIVVRSLNIVGGLMTSIHLFRRSDQKKLVRGGGVFQFVGQGDD